MTREYLVHIMYGILVLHTHYSVIKIGHILSCSIIKCDTIFKMEVNNCHISRTTFRNYKKEIQQLQLVVVVLYFYKILG